MNDCFVAVAATATIAAAVADAVFSSFFSLSFRMYLKFGSALLHFCPL